MMTHRGNEPPSAKERNPNYGLQMDLHTKRVSMKNSSILKSEVEPLICDYVPKNQIIVHNDLQLLFPHDVLPMDGLTRYQEPAFREIRSGQKVNDSIYNSFKVYVPAASLMMLNSFSAFNGLKIEFSESKECLNMSYMIEQVSNYNYCEKFTMIVQMHEHYHLVCTKIRNIICTIPGLKNLKLPQKRTACSGLIECPEPLTNDFTNIIKAYNLKVELFGGYADVDHISNGYFWCFGIAKVKSYPQFSLFFSDMLLCCRSNLSDEMLVHQLSMHHNENIFNFSRAICVNDYCNFPAALPTPQRIRVVASIFASVNVLDKIPIRGIVGCHLNLLNSPCDRDGFFLTDTRLLSARN